MSNIQAKSRWRSYCHTEQIEATSGEDHLWRIGRLQSRKEHHRADLQPENPLCVQHQQDLYRVFIDFKKAFNRVWHEALWATRKMNNISTNLIQVIKNLYNKATSAVLFNGSIGDWFRTTVGVLQGCLLSHKSSTYFWKGSWQTP